MKDLGIAVRGADESNASIPLGKKSLELYEGLIEEGLSKKDFGVIYKRLLEGFKR